MTSMYLKPTVKIEPLIWSWYAWPYLIPPIAAGCNIVERHLKIMQSYVLNPMIHAQALKDPKMLGGPFLDLGGEKVKEIEELIKWTQEECSQFIALNDAYKDLDQILQTEAQGDSIEHLYPKVHDALKGLVELVYDLNNHPSIRLIERLIYEKYYHLLEKGQKIALSDTTMDYRSFLLSTPRINQDNEVYLNIPFSDPKIDDLLKMKYKPGDPLAVANQLQIDKVHHTHFMNLFTDTPPSLSPDRKYNDDGIRIRYFGHACVLLQTKSTSILFDPVISYPIESTDTTPRYTFNDLPDSIDYVIFTHNHQDHILFETLLQLRHKIKNIIFPASNSGALQDPSIKLILSYTGFNCNLIELKEMDQIFLPKSDGVITGLPFFGEHSDLNIQSKMAYSVKIKDSHLLFAADSRNLDSHLYDNIFHHIGSIDILFLGMECDGAPLTWLYGPLLTKPLKRSYDKNRTLSGSDFDRAFSIAKKSGCKEAYVYAMGQEPWLGYIMALQYTPDSPQIIESNRFIDACRANGIKSERPFGKKEWIINKV
jgi:L-ascorbate metabolism protein UlaG (beta-lactamase superfamily)